MQDLRRTNLQTLLSHIGMRADVTRATGIHRQTILATAAGRREPHPAHLRALERAYGLPIDMLDGPVDDTPGPIECQRSEQRIEWLAFSALTVQNGQIRSAHTPFRVALRWISRHDKYCSAWFAREAARELGKVLPKHLGPAPDATDMAKRMFSSVPDTDVPKGIAATTAERRWRSYAAIPAPTKICEALEHADIEMLRSAVRSDLVDLANPIQLAWAHYRVQCLEQAGRLVGITAGTLHTWLYRQRDRHHTAKQNLRYREMKRAPQRAVA